MGLLMWLLALAFAGLGAIGIHLVASDLYERAPISARKLIAAALLRLPLRERQRYGEEWLAHLEETVGSISKLAHALECFFCARTLGKLLAVTDKKAASVERSDGAAMNLDLETAYFFCKEMLRFYESADTTDPATVQVLRDQIQYMEEAHGAIAAPNPVKVREAFEFIERGFRQSKT